MVASRIAAARSVPADTGGREALLITSELRAAGLKADRAFENRSMKAQMKAADRSGATVAVIIGSDELAAGTAVVRPMRGGDQRVVARADLLSDLRTRIP